MRYNQTIWVIQQIYLWNICFAVIAQLYVPMDIIHCCLVHSNYHLLLPDDSMLYHLLLPHRKKYHPFLPGSSIKVINYFCLTWGCYHLLKLLLPDWSMLYHQLITCFCLTGTTYHLLLPDWNNLSPTFAWLEQLITYFCLTGATYHLLLPDWSNLSPAFAWLEQLITYFAWLNKLVTHKTITYIWNHILFISHIYFYRNFMHLG